MILEGDIAAGERLNEQAIAARLGVSRGPVREAHRLLETAGLVVAVPNKGVFVRRLQRDEMAENYDIRALITGFQCALAARHATVAQVAALERAVAEMAAAIAEDDTRAYYDHNIAFHALLAEAAGHEHARRIYDDLVKQSYQRRQATLSPERSNAEHAEILAAIKAGDAEAARRLGEQHVLNGKARWFARMT
jgi:DNA-binding GntR family transcriptional regulator